MASGNFGLRLDLNSERGRRLLAVLPGLMRAHALRAFQAMARDFENTMRARFVAAEDPRHEFLHNRTGRLQQSIKAEVLGAGTLSQLQLRARASGLPYINLQEYGGTILPTGGGRFLTIPARDNLTPAGVARYPSAAALRHSSSMKTWVGRTRSGALVIYGRKPGSSTRSRPLVLWTLVRSAKVPARLGFRSTFAALGERRRYLLQRALESASREAQASV